MIGLGLKLENVAIPQYGIKDGSVTLGCYFDLEHDKFLVLKWYEIWFILIIISPQLKESRENEFALISTLILTRLGTKENKNFFVILSIAILPSSLFRLMVCLSRCDYIFFLNAVHCVQNPETKWNLNDGLCFQIMQSSMNQVVLKNVSLRSSGSYRCEVTVLPSFRTLSQHGDLIVVGELVLSIISYHYPSLYYYYDYGSPFHNNNSSLVIPIEEKVSESELNFVAPPRDLPVIDCHPQTIQTGETLKCNCTSYASKPTASLMYYLNEGKVSMTLFVRFALISEGSLLWHSHFLTMY